MAVTNKCVESKLGMSIKDFHVYKRLKDFRILANISSNNVSSKLFPSNFVVSHTQNHFLMSKGVDGSQKTIQNFLLQKTFSRTNI